MIDREIREPNDFAIITHFSIFKRNLAAEIKNNVHGQIQSADEMKV
ncbi:hypothetical protein HMPREF9372_0914 [Sporosarcina newyorkensis 2681]|uniref:Uncharacterized protein n=1 Tax=Sporosarcina newyorkensis 2681 TaxID=1027292 RepID=F9DQ34_9BACL|nr:hypothetical protein HMPREF9372_0914 [Sporosarcina newyorkensis 2681]